MAPEQSFKQPEPASDGYTLGMLTYVLLTKEFPFDDQNPEKIQHLKSSAQYTPIREKLRGVPSAFSNVITKMLSTNPSARYSTCARFVEDLRNVLNSNSTIETSVPDKSLSEVSEDSPKKIGISVGEIGCYIGDG